MPKKESKLFCKEVVKLSRGKFIGKEFEFWFEHESYGDILTTSSRKDHTHKDAWDMVKEAFLAGADAHRKYMKLREKDASEH